MVGQETVPQATGMSVRLTTIETNKAMESDKLSDWKNCPITPPHERQRQGFTREW